MNQNEKMRLFTNQPRFLKGYSVIHAGHLRKSDQREIFLRQNLMYIFPEYSNIERYKNLKEAREKVSADKEIDTSVIQFITKLHKTAQEITRSNDKLEKEKQMMVKKFEIKTSALEIDQNMNKLIRNLEKYEGILNTITKQKKQIEKMMKITEIRNALLMQNNILQEENQRLKRRDGQLDQLLRQKP